MEEAGFFLPPGFRFHPTDEEIITHYLSQKILNHGFVARAMGVVELNKCEPWDLPGKAKMGEKEWYFFCQRDRKYPTGSRTNRATASGYWKATGKDKEIFRGSGVLVGMRKTLVFYTGRAPKGEKTNWVMHEFRLQEKPSTLSNLHKPAKDEWVVCRVFHKTGAGVKRGSTSPNAGSLRRINSFSDEPPDSFMLPPLVDPPLFNESFDIKELLASSAPMTDSYLFSPAVDGEDNCNKYVFVNKQEASAAMQQSPPPQPIKRHCKAEQLSNQSMLSQDTGLSTDRYAEISSAITKRDIDLEGFDLYSMWRC